jgi:epoxide hydrolase-like predicted phosphatase
MMRAVIFDYGSVLARTLDPHPRAVWEEQLGLEPGGLQQRVHNDTSWIEVQCGRLSVEAYWCDVGQQLGLKPPETARMRNDFYRGDKRNDELVAYIDQVRAAGLRTAVLSNFSKELRSFLEHHTLLDHFDQIAISAEIGVMKPSAKAYQAVLAMLDLPAAACVFVDDQPGNIDAAEALGMRGIVFRDNPSCIEELTQLLGHGKQRDLKC